MIPSGRVTLMIQGQGQGTRRDKTEKTLLVALKLGLASQSMIRGQVLRKDAVLSVTLSSPRNPIPRSLVRI